MRGNVISGMPKALPLRTFVSCQKPADLVMFI